MWVVGQQGWPTEDAPFCHIIPQTKYLNTSELRTVACTPSEIDNGVNATALIEARETLTDAPEAARFQWRATAEWKDGTHTESRINSFFGLGEEQRHVREFRFDTDHPDSTREAPRRLVALGHRRQHESRLRS